MSARLGRTPAVLLKVTDDDESHDVIAHCEWPTRALRVLTNIPRSWPVTVMDCPLLDGKLTVTARLWVAFLPHSSMVNVPSLSLVLIAFEASNHVALSLSPTTSVKATSHTMSLVGLLW